MTTLLPTSKGQIIVEMKWRDEEVDKKSSLATADAKRFSVLKVF